MRAFRILAAVALAAAPAAGQSASASAAALGMGDNYTAAARGYNAVAWNPAALGLVDAPGFSLTVLALRGGNGLAPVTLGDLADWADQVVPDAVRRDWLTRIAADGAQRGSGEVEATWLALQVDRLAFQASTSVRARTDVSPGVAELIMFGNGGSDGFAREIDLSGSTLGARAWSTLAASLAVPWKAEMGIASIGATVTYTVGHVLASGEPSTGNATASPAGVRMEFPLVQTSFDEFRASAGGGFGLDVAAAFQGERWTVSAVRHNIASSFRWDVDRLEYRPLGVSLSEDDAQTRTDAVPLTEAPAELRDRIAGLGFRPSWAFGAAFRPSDRFLATADARFAETDDMMARPLRHLGAGAEVAVLPWLPVRAGGAHRQDAAGDDVWQVAGGFGVRAGPWGVNAAVAREVSSRLGGSTVFMLSLTSLGAH